MEFDFDHEKLTVYQKSLQFISWLSGFEDRMNKKVAALEHLDRASTSIAQNIAEGNGRYTPRDRCRFFDIARGSALECASSLDTIYAKKMASKDDVNEGKSILREIVSMLVGLIRSNSDRVFENDAVYEP